ncbi:hypothetical protein BH23CHL2_BH23CHL2_21910 [soil metagenome]
MNLTTTAPITVQDLEAHGFSAVEISRLQQRKDRYDGFQEYCESDREYERLCFLKWRYEQGELQEAITG